MRYIEFSVDASFICNVTAELICVTYMYEMFDKAYAFNQDISSWDVSSVTYCSQFSLDATAWTEPKPNFTNCTE